VLAGWMLSAAGVYGVGIVGDLLLAAALAAASCAFLWRD
jgi:hypothetical protein